MLSLREDNDIIYSSMGLSNEILRHIKETKQAALAAETESARIQAQLKKDLTRQIDAECARIDKESEMCREILDRLARPMLEDVRQNIVGGPESRVSTEKFQPRNYIDSYCDKHEKSGTVSTLKDRRGSADIVLVGIYPEVARVGISYEGDFRTEYYYEDKIIEDHFLLGFEARYINNGKFALYVRRNATCADELAVLPDDQDGVLGKVRNSIKEQVLEIIPESFDPGKDTLYSFSKEKVEQWKAQKLAQRRALRSPRKGFLGWLDKIYGLDE